MYDWVRPLLQFLRREDGPTAVEYAVMLALILMVCFIAIQTLGTATNALFDHAASKTAPMP